PAAGAYFSGSADFNIRTASNVSLPVPCKTVSTDCSYMASNVLLATLAPGPRPPTAKPRISLMATAGTEPAKVRGSAPPMDTARNGDGCASFTPPMARFSQPSSVDFKPGVPDSM